MKLVNKNIGTVNYSELENSGSIEISNCVIETINFDMFDADIEVIIENCVITNFLIHSSWFVNGLIFRNNIIVNHLDYVMGGHNNKPIVIAGNIFNGFVNFFDCQFNETLILKNNIFIKGSNLLGNDTEGFKNTFEKECIIINNLGEINLNQLNN